jgi:hypothetical protein
MSDTLRTWLAVVGGIIIPLIVLVVVVIAM